MTKEEARIIVLEEALIEAIHTIDYFIDLDNICCAEEIHYSPNEEITKDLPSLKKLVTIPEGCIHSKFDLDCKECVDSMMRRNRLEEAKIVLGIQ